MAVERDQSLLFGKSIGFWRLLFLYWRSSEKKSAWVSLILISILILVVVGFSIAFSYWNNYFYTALQAYQKNKVFQLLGGFAILALFYIIFEVLRLFVMQTFLLRWRNWLTQQLMTRWISRRTYYYLENIDQKTDNPDQRIQEDAQALVGSALSIYSGLLNAVMTLAGFLFVLWELSGNFSISFGSLGNYVIHGYLIWVALFYSAIGTWLAIKIGRPLVGLNFEQQKREANFRYAAIYLRTHADHVALYRGERREGDKLKGLFASVLQNAYDIVYRQMKLLSFTSGFGQLAVFLPLMVALPNYFNKVFLFGGLIQMLTAFDKVQTSFSFIVNAYADIANWQAVVKRLSSFVNHMNDIDARLIQHPKLTVVQGKDNHLLIQNLTVYRPSGEPLLKNIHLNLVGGKHYLFRGASGLGKSTVVRAIADLWAFSKGQIILPNQKIFYLPQKPYMPIGSLRQAIVFPAMDSAPFDADLVNWLSVCDLSHLIKVLDCENNWAEQLSLGEQQRIGFVRALLHKPSWIFLDESTSQLDSDNEKKMYGLLKQYLPHSTWVSIAHRESLISMHDEVIDLGVFKAGSSPSESAELSIS